MEISKVRFSKVLFISMTLLGLTIASQPAQADVPPVPTLLSFTITPDSVDVVTSNTTITLDLIVNSPTGIFTTQTIATLTDGGANTLAIPLVRTESPVSNSLQTVEFKANYKLPSNLPAGVYKATAAPIYSLTSSAGQGYPIPELKATTTSTTLGAANALLVRNAGDLNFGFPTFVGPSFNRLLPRIFTNPKYNLAPAPIWKVGEVFNPSDYYELKVPTLALIVKVSTPKICTTNGTTLNLIATGDCGFIVYTNKSAEYQYKEDIENVTVTEARTKPSFQIGTVTTQNSNILPLSIQGPVVYSPFGLVIPAAITPSVCYPVGSFISIISGGTCTLNYSTPATADYVASEVTTLNFEITRSPQTVTFALPTTAELATKTLALSASSSSGAAVTYQTSSSNICAVTGNSLSLLRPGNCQVTAVQAGSAKIEPASITQTVVVLGAVALPVKKPLAKKIICVKGRTSKTAVGSKCPKGYTVKK
jgi:hypothetical protein